MVNLGDAYSDGRGVPKDGAAAVQWYRKAADAGQADAMLELGNAYARGLGVVPDRAQAADWYRKAADAGSVAARIKLKLLGDPSKPGRTTRPR